jgi:hypothetical protein
MTQPNALQQSASKREYVVLRGAGDVLAQNNTSQNSEAASAIEPWAPLSEPVVALFILTLRRNSHAEQRNDTDELALVEVF